MANDRQTRKSAERLTEEALYEQVAQEMKQGLRREGLWLKAYSEASGDETRAKSIYIELRKQSLIDEHVVSNAAEEARAAAANTSEAREARKQEEYRRNKEQRRAEKSQFKKETEESVLFVVKLVVGFILLGLALSFFDANM